MWRCLILTVLLFTASADAGLPKHEYWPAHVDADGHFYGHRHSGSFTLFFPALQAGNSVLFGQGTVGRFEEVWMATLGGGIRAMMADDFAWGFSLFGDVGRSDSGLTWGQGGIGVEVLGWGWEFRANGYIPQLVTRTAQRIRRVTTQVVGVDVQITDLRQTELETARWGFDVEGGCGIELGPGSLWGYGGYFRFEGQDLPKIEGPRLRIEYKLPLPLAWGNFEIWSGAEWQHTKEFGHEGSFLLHLQLPLGCQRSLRCCPKVSVCNRMGDSVRRQNGIILKRRTQRVVTERAQQLIFANNTLVAGPGTQTAPTSLNDAITRANPGDVIFLLNNAGNAAIDASTAPGGVWNLTTGQGAISFDAQTSVTVDFSEGAMVVVNDLTGFGQARLNQPVAASNAIELGDNNTVFGFIISGGRTGISGTSKATSLIANMTIGPEGANPAPTTAGIELIDMTGSNSLVRNMVTGTTAAGSTGIIVTNTGTTGIFNLLDNTISRGATLMANGALITGTDASTMTVNLLRNTVNGPFSNGIFVQKTGSGGIMNVAAANNALESVGTMTATSIGAFAFFTTPGTTGYSYALNMQNNTVTDSPTIATIMVWRSTAAATATFQALVQGNTYTRVGGLPGAAFGVVADGEFVNAADTATIQVASNTVTQVLGTAYQLGDTGAGTVNATYTNNVDSATTTPATLQAYEMSRGPTPGTTCLTMTGNSSTGRNAATATEGPIQLANTGGTFNITNYGTNGATLMTNNNNLTVRSSGSITDVTTNCPTPTVPVIPNL